MEPVFHYDENFALTRKVEKAVHTANIQVEAEIGQIGKIDSINEPGIARKKIAEFMADS